MGKGASEREVADIKRIEFTKNILKLLKDRKKEMLEALKLSKAIELDSEEIKYIKRNAKKALKALERSKKKIEQAQEHEIDSEAKRNAKKALEALEQSKKIVLEQAREGEIDAEVKRKAMELVNLLNTVGDEKASYRLKLATDMLERAINPKWPYDFPDELLIQECYMIYEEAFRFATIKHGHGWEKIIQNAAISAYSRDFEGLKGQLSEFTELVKAMKNRSME